MFLIGGISWPVFCLHEDAACSIWTHRICHQCCFSLGKKMWVALPLDHRFSTRVHVRIILFYTRKIFPKCTHTVDGFTLLVTIKSYPSDKCGTIVLKITLNPVILNLELRVCFQNNEVCYRHIKTACLV